MQIACRHCGQKASVDSLINAAQQNCDGCGNFVMGDRVAPAPAESSHGTGSAAASKSSRSAGGLKMGAIIGALVGLVVALAVAVLADAMPVSTQGMILGALAGVLLGPLIIVGVFISAFVSKHSMFVSVEDLATEGLADRIADAVNERRFGKLASVVSLFLLLGMVVGGFGGSHSQAISPLLILGAAVGALSLGALIGAPLGAMFLVAEDAEEPQPQKPAVEERPVPAEE